MSRQVTTYIRRLHAAMKVREDLLKKEYLPQSLGRERRHYTEGHCYAVSEALWFLLGAKAAGWKPMCVTHEGGTHWFVEHQTTKKRYDLTAKQFLTPVPYDNAVCRGFQNRDQSKPSRRAQAFIDMVMK